MCDVSSCFIVCCVLLVNEVNIKQEAINLLAFVDESGFPHPNDETLRPVLASVCMSEDDLRKMIQTMYRIKKDIFGRTDVEVKATQMVRPRVFTRYTRGKQCTDRIITEIVSGLRTLRVFAVVMTHPEDVPYQLVDSEFLVPHYRYLLQRIHAYAYDRSEKAVVVFDSRDDGEDRKVVNHMKNWLFRSQEGQAMTSLVQTAFFVSSKVEEGIQLADLVAGIIRMYHESLGPLEFREWLNELYSKISSRTMELEIFDKSWPGIYEMPERVFYN